MKHTDPMRRGGTATRVSMTSALATALLHACSCSHQAATTPDAGLVDAAFAPPDAAPAPPLSAVLRVARERICAGECVDLVVDIAGGAPMYSLAWADDSSAGATRTVCPTRPTTYAVTVGDSSTDDEFGNPPVRQELTITIASAGECDGGMGTRELCRATLSSPSSIGTQVDSAGSELALSDQGDAIVAGWFRGDMLDGQRTIRSLGDSDAFLASIDADCHVRWTQQFGGAGAQTWLGAPAIDEQGQIYVGGGWVGTVAFGSTTLTSPGSLGFGATILMKLDASGALLWAHPIARVPAECEVTAPAAAAAGQRAVGCAAFCGITDVEIDREQQLVVSGCAAADADIGGMMPGGATGQAVLAAKLDGDGNARWIQRVDNAGFDVELALDPAGDVYLRGWGGDVFTDVAAGPVVTLGMLTRDLSSGLAGGHYIAKVGADGSEAWMHGVSSQSFHNDWRFWSSGIATDARGRLIVARDEAIENDAGALQRYVQHVDVLDSAGTPVWSRPLTDVATGSGQQAWFGSVTTDRDGNILWVGAFMTATNYDGVALEPLGYMELAVVKLDQDGNVRWVHRLGGDNEYAYSMGIKADAAGHVFVAYANGRSPDVHEVTLVKLAP